MKMERVFLVVLMLKIRIAAAGYVLDSFEQTVWPGAQTMYLIPQLGTSVCILFSVSDLPKGIRLDSAHVQFTAYNPGDKSMRVKITMHNIGSATTCDGVSSQGAKVSHIWIPSKWSVGKRTYKERASGLVNTFQALINDPSWQQTQTVAVLFELPDGDNFVESRLGSQPTLQVWIPDDYKEDVVVQSVTAFNELEGCSSNIASAEVAYSSIIQQHQMLGYFFNFTAPPSNAVVEHCKMLITVEAMGQGNPNLDIFAYNHKNIQNTAADTCPFQADGNLVTAASVQWTIKDRQVGETIETPDLIPLIDELKQNMNWSIGDNLLFVIKSRSNQSTAHVKTAATQSGTQSMPVLNCIYSDKCDAWRQYSSCNPTCGLGRLKTRSRDCYSSLYYPGNPSIEEDVGECSDTVCPYWLSWGEWSSCSTTCGPGQKYAVRECSTSNACGAGSTKATNCILQTLCPDWSTWEAWGSCSVSCEEGNQTRTRECQNGGTCLGDSFDIQICVSMPTCPTWNSWGSWSVCSVTCQDGIQNRERNCSHARLCDGESIDTQICSEDSICPFWLSWGNWEECSESCGQGSQTRTRCCSKGNLCREGNATDIQSCSQLPYCPGWNAWRAWSGCSVTCLEGSQTRSRDCPIDGICNGSSNDTQECVIHAACPEWGQWGLWSQCSVSCEMGIHSRERNCSMPGLCIGGEAVDVQNCMEMPSCPVWSEWMQWSDCDILCKYGNKTRRRNCSHVDLCDGIGLEIGSCLDNTGCEVWNSWLPWQGCGASCGAGWDKRYRTCTKPYRCDGDPADVRSCLTNRSCEDFNQLSHQWSSWGECDPVANIDCGDGLRTRLQRVCSFGQGCKSGGGEEEPCDIQCILDGYWSPWHAWGECSVTCGGGRRTRIHWCNNPYPQNGGRSCDGPSFEEGLCNTQRCQVDGQWNDWSEWSMCNRYCGSGEEVRERQCNAPSPLFGGNDCIGSNKEMQPCLNPPCSGPSSVTATMRVTSMEYNDELVDPMSQIYQDTESILQSEVTASLADRGVDVNEFAINSFTPGSVICSFNISFINSQGIEIQIFQTLVEESSPIGSLVVSGTTVSLQNSSSSWYIPTPMITALHASSSTSVNVSWDCNAMAASNIDGYLVLFKKLAANTTGYDVVLASNTSCSSHVIFLEEFTYYTFRVTAFSMASVSLASSFEDIRTMQAEPSTAPLQLSCHPFSYDTILLTWSAIPDESWNGIQRGYMISYGIYNSSQLQNVTVSPGQSWVSLNNITSNSFYDIEVMALTDIGAGPPSYVQCSTEEQGTLFGIENVTILQSQQTPTSIMVMWNPLEVDSATGLLLSYTVKYGVSIDGDKVIPAPVIMSQTIGPYTTIAKLTNLPINSEVIVQVYGSTKIGNGPYSNPIRAETCRCPQRIFTSWFQNSHRVYLDLAVGRPKGTFIEYLDKMINAVCGNCPGVQAGTNGTQIYFDRTKDGSFAEKLDEDALKESVDGRANVFLPIYQHAAIDVFQEHYRFIALEKESKMVFITRSPLASVKATKVLKALFAIWPMAVIIALVTCIAGILIMFLDRPHNEEFSSTSLHVSFFQGFWCAFVTMTTVGYGDFSPRGKAARTLTIIWTFGGLVLTSILVGALTTALTVIDAGRPSGLYGTKVAVLNDTFEMNFAIRRNADITSTDRNFTTVLQMIEALVDEVVDGILIDQREVASTNSVLKKRHLEVSRSYVKPFGFGMVITADLLQLENTLRSYVKSNAIDNEVNSRDVDELQSPSGLDITMTVIESGIPQLGWVLLVAIFIGLLWINLKPLVETMLRRNKVEDSGRNLEVDGSATMTELVDNLHLILLQKMQTMDRKHLAERLSLLHQRGIINSAYVSYM